WVPRVHPPGRGPSGLPYFRQVLYPARVNPSTSNATTNSGGPTTPQASSSHARLLRRSSTAWSLVKGASSPVSGPLLRRWSCYRRLQVRWERDSARFLAFVLLACA